jgi:hypothetical protein
LSISPRGLIHNTVNNNWGRGFLDVQAECVIFLLAVSILQCNGAENYYQSYAERQIKIPAKAFGKCRDVPAKFHVLFLILGLMA